jgi:transposase
MSTRIHPQARTTPEIRQQIRNSGLSSREAAKVFHVSHATAAKWLKRDDVLDRSHRAHTLHTTLSASQEVIVLALRESLCLPLDDLLYVTRQFINADVSRAGLARLLKRQGVSRLENIIPMAEGETRSPKKTLKDIDPGFIHIAITSLPQFHDATSPRYLFMAIDRATRWVFTHIYGDVTDENRADFLRHLTLASPMKITDILTAKGALFPRCFASACAHAGIQHRWQMPCGSESKDPGNQRVQQIQFDSQAGLETTMRNFVKLYNHRIPQRAIGNRTPIQALEEWRRTQRRA